MIIKTRINNQGVRIILSPAPKKQGELISFIVSDLSWEGKTGTINADDKELDNLWDYLNSSLFELPEIKIDKMV